MDEERAAEAQEGIHLRLVWDIPLDTPTYHADEMLIGTRGDYFLLTIGQHAEPLLSPNDEHAVARLREAGTISIRPLIRVAIPRNRMLQWARVISDHVNQVPDMRSDTTHVAADDQDETEGGRDE